MCAPDVFAHVPGVVAHRQWVSAGACGHTSLHSRTHNKIRSPDVGERLDEGALAHTCYFRYSLFKAYSIETFTFIKYMEITYAPGVVIYVERLFYLLVFH